MKRLIYILTITVLSIGCGNSNPKEKLIGNWQLEYDSNKYSYITFTKDSAFGYVKDTIGIRLQYEVYGDTIFFGGRKDLANGFTQSHSLIISVGTDTLILDNEIGRLSVHVKALDSPIPELISK